MTPEGPATGRYSTDSGEPGGRAQRHMARLIIALSAGVVVVVLLLVYLLVNAADPEPIAGPPPGTGDQSSGATTDPTRGAAPSAPRSQATPIVIDPVAGPPLCASFRGSGDVPQGRTLWLTVVSDEHRYYFFPTVPELHRWTAENVTLGIPEEKPGEPFTVLAVLADATGDKNIEKLEGKGARSLPEGVEEKHKIYVRRGAGEQECQE